MIKENDGMRYPSIDQLADKTSSKYRLVVGVAKRAKEIKQDNKILIEEHKSFKPIGIALEEVLADKIKIK